MTIPGAGSQHCCNRQLWFAPELRQWQAWNSCGAPSKAKSPGPVHFEDKGTEFRLGLAGDFMTRRVFRSNAVFSCRILPQRKPSAQVETQQQKHLHTCLSSCVCVCVNVCACVCLCVCVRVCMKRACAYICFCTCIHAYLQTWPLHSKSFTEEHQSLSPTPRFVADPKPWSLRQDFRLEVNMTCIKPSPEPKPTAEHLTPKATSDTSMSPGHVRNRCSVHLHPLCPRKVKLPANSRFFRWRLCWKHSCDVYVCRVYMLRAGWRASPYSAQNTSSKAPSSASMVNSQHRRNRPLLPRHPRPGV